MNSFALKFRIIIVSIFATGLLSAQFNQQIIAPQYLFNEFKIGEVYVKDNPVQTTLMNYNTLAQEMLFKRDTTTLKLTNLSTIDSVVIENRVFIPIEGFFYERIINSKLQLLIRNRTSWESEGAMAGYGRSKLAKTTETTMISGAGSIKFLNPDVPVKIYDDPEYYIYANNKKLFANNPKNYRQLFPEHEKVFKSYIKDNKLNLKKKEDMIRYILLINKFLDRNEMLKQNNSKN